MQKQKFQNGLWIGKTLFISPGCLSFFHLVPFAFVVAMLVTGILEVCGVPWVSALFWTAYAMVTVTMTALTIVHEREKHPLLLLLPVIFLILHLSYG